MQVYDGNEKSLSSFHDIQKFSVGPGKVLDFLSKSLHFNDEPRFPNYIAGLSKKTIIGAKNENTIVGAIDLIDEKARVKTVIEGFERHSLFCPNGVRRTVFCKPAELSGNSMPIDLLVRVGQKYSKKEKKLVWTKAYDFFSKQEIYVPTQSVFLFYHYSEPRLFPLISTGAAAGTKYCGATYRAICEILERDAFMIHFLNKLSPPHINADGLDENIDYILSKFKRYNLKVLMLDITTENKVPSFLSILIDSTGVGPYFTFGLKSDLNAIEAIKGSLLEAYQGREWIREKMMDPKKKKIEIDATGFSSQLDRALFWSDKRMQNSLQFFMWGSKKTVTHSKNFRNDNKRLKTLLRMLSEVGTNRILFKDITCSHITDKRIKIVKVLMPQMQPLYLDEHFKCFTERDINVPKLLGYKEKSYSELNNVPQPFI
jgi:ribosomal protein S12 methylthiotransferase accessory factor